LSVLIPPGLLPVHMIIVRSNRAGALQLSICAGLTGMQIPKEFDHLI